MTPGAGVHKVIYNAYNAIFLFLFLSTLGHGSDKWSLKQSSAKIVNFITIEDLGLMLGRGYMNHYSTYALFSTLSIYTTLIASAHIWREYNAAFLCHCWFSFIPWKYEPFRQEVSVQSLTLRLRPSGLLFKT